MLIPASYSLYLNCITERNDALLDCRAINLLPVILDAHDLRCVVYIHCQHASHTPNAVLHDRHTVRTVHPFNRDDRVVVAVDDLRPGAFSHPFHLLQCYQIGIIMQAEINGGLLALQVSAKHTFMLSHSGFQSCQATIIVALNAWQE